MIDPGSYRGPLYTLSGAINLTKIIAVKNRPCYFATSTAVSKEMDNTFETASEPIVIP